MSYYTCSFVSNREKIACKYIIKEKKYYFCREIH